MSKFKQDTIVTFLKNYGFVFANSEIYGGYANAWDYGPLGSLLKNNIKALWWKEFVTSVPNAVGVDTAIISNPIVFKASGHVDGFSDPLIDCKKCHQRFRADKLIEANVSDANISENTKTEILTDIIKTNNVPCPSCGASDWTEVRKFNLMYKTYQGVTDDTSSLTYLRPETCQTIFVDFNQILRTSRQKLPFAVCQIGKSFRNEITPGNFIFRTREFEQAEIEYFTYHDNVPNEFPMWIEKVENFLFNELGFDKSHVYKKEIPANELAHYSSRTIDFQYDFPHGMSELWGLAHRGTYDLTNHGNMSKKDLSYLEPDGTRIVPEVIEPSVGVDRLFYAIVCEKYDVEKVGEEEREVLHLPYSLCPYKCAILPLSNKLSDKAYPIYLNLLKKGISCQYDISGSIGKRYRRQDAIGTMYCITYDFESEANGTVTIRNRDTMKQEVVKIEDINKYIF